MHNSAASEREREEMMTYLKEISTGFSSTIADLSGIVKVQNNQIEQKPVNLHDYAKRAIDILRMQVMSSGGIINNNIDSNILILASPAYLESIVLNFLSNSIKYRHPDRSPVIDLDASQSRGEVVLRVADNGLGIDLAKHKGDLFGMYKTFHSHPESNGVGLFLVKSQLDAMGAAIEVESEVGTGTTFIVHFKAMNSQPG
jgi:signal transduction histidine kinase